MMEHARRLRILTVAGILILTALTTWLAASSGFVAGLDRAMLDRSSVAKTSPAGNEVLLVAIDDKSLGRLGRWPWSRMRHAELIATLRRAGARVIALDVLLAEPDPSNPQADAALAAAIAAHGQVLLPVPALDPQSGRSVAASMAMLWPAAHFVHSDIEFEPDGMVRNLHRWADSGDVSLPALPLALLNPELAIDARQLHGLSVARRPPGWERTDPVLVTNMALAEQLPVYSYADVLDGTVDADIFRDRRVVVGVTAQGFGQRFMTPRSSLAGQSLAGVQLSAIAANELSGGFGIQPVSAPARIAISLLLALAVVAGMLGLRRRWTLLTLAIGLLLALLLPMLALRQSLWLGTMPAVAGMLVGGLCVLGWRAQRARQRAQQVMRDAQRLASGLVEAVVALNRNGDIVFASAGRSGLLPELSASHMRQRSLPDLVRTVPPIQQLLDAHAQAGQPSVHQADLIGPTGVLEPVTLHVSPSNVYSPDGLMVTLTRRNDPALPAQGDAATALDADPLTGLATRGLLWAELEARAHTPAATSTGTLLVLGALDGFKRINEALGMGEGDRVLVEVARRLRGIEIPDAVLARWSGDQFAAMLPCNDGEAQARRLTQRVHGLLSALQVLPGSITLNASVGAAHAPAGADAADLALLVQRAERALREVKRGGGGRWLLEGGDYAGWTRETLAKEQELRHAIAQRQFHMQYQPIMDVRSGRFASMEALIRWHHPQRGTLAPGAFLDLAEELGLEVDLGELAFERVQDDMRVLAQHGVVLPVSVNVSARHFERPDFAEQIAALELASTPGRLKIEVTESMALIDPARAARQVLALEQQGVGVALDDFGCGHSSLALLRSLRIRQVKIDRSFVSGADHDAGAQALVRAIIGMAQALDLEIVAEGVETPEQSQWLLQLGCHLQQGYLFARPMPPEQLAEKLR